jgi:hypothetical protein
MNDRNLIELYTFNEFLKNDKYDVISTMLTKRKYKDQHIFETIIEILKKQDKSKQNCKDLFMSLINRELKK